MANVKISDLTPASGVADANEFEINESGSSKKVTGTQISSYVRGDIVTADITDVTITATELEYLDGVTSPIQGQINGKVSQTSSTGSAELPAGTTAERDGTPSAGYIRFNSTDSTFEGYDGSAWGSIGGAGGGLFKGENGEVGSSAGDIFRVNEQTLNTDVTIDADENANATGPLTVASGITLTVTSGGNLSIV